jgi:hypothetical protein
MEADTVWSDVWTGSDDTVRRELLDREPPSPLARSGSKLPKLGVTVPSVTSIITLVVTDGPREEVVNSRESADSDMLVIGVSIGIGDSGTVELVLTVKELAVLLSVEAVGSPDEAMVGALGKERRAVVVRLPLIGPVLVKLSIGSDVDCWTVTLSGDRDRSRPKVVPSVEIGAPDNSVGMSEDGSIMDIE